MNAFRSNSTPAIIPPGDDNIEANEEYDAFPTRMDSTEGPLFDLSAIESENRARRGIGGGEGAGGVGRSSSSRASRSMATTQLASDVGSTIGATKNPFLKSITFFDPKVYYRNLERAKAKAKAQASGEEGGERGEVENGVNGESGVNGAKDGEICKDCSAKGGDEEKQEKENSGAGANGNSKSGPNGEDDNVSDILDDGSEAGVAVTPDDEPQEDDDLTFDIVDLTHWEISLSDTPPEPKKKSLLRSLSGKLKRKSTTDFKKLYSIDDYEGLIEYSSIQSGDYLVSVNKHKITKDEYTLEEAEQFMSSCLAREGVLNIITENPAGDDIVINLTVIKPRPTMTYEELGLEVWNWPYLCVREIHEGSIFEHTAIREQDQIAAINDIDCGKMKVKGFAKCVRELPVEITITLIRRKHRYTGSFS